MQKRAANTGPTINEAVQVFSLIFDSQQGVMLMSTKELTGLSIPKQEWGGEGPVAITVTAEKASNAKLQIDQLVGKFTYCINTLSSSK